MIGLGRILQYDRKVTLVYSIEAFLDRLAELLCRHSSASSRSATYIALLRVRCHHRRCFVSSCLERIGNVKPQSVSLPNIGGFAAGHAALHCPSGWAASTAPLIASVLAAHIAAMAAPAAALAAFSAAKATCASALAALAASFNVFILAIKAAALGEGPPKTTASTALKEAM